MKSNKQNGRPRVGYAAFGDDDFVRVITGEGTEHEGNGHNTVDPVDEPDDEPEDKPDTTTPTEPTEPTEPTTETEDADQLTTVAVTDKPKETSTSNYL